MNARTIRVALSSAVVLLLVNLISAAVAHDYALGELKIVRPWTHATPTGATTGVAYMSLTNTGSVPIRLTGASTPAAQRVEIHMMSVEGGVMRMRLVPGFDIAPGATVELEPGGMHLMLVGLNRQLHQEDAIPLTLAFGNGATISIDLHVEAIGGGPSAHNH